MDLTERTEVFKALGHPARLAMVDALAKGELCAAELVKVAGTGWPTVSRHLSILAAAGVVTHEKCGRSRRYRLRLACISSMERCMEDASLDCEGSCVAEKGAAK